MCIREKAGAITDKEGAMLSAISLVHSWLGMGDEEKASFIDRGLVEDGNFHLSDVAQLAISAYPLLGDGNEQEIFPECFHAMLAAAESEKEAEAAALLCFPAIDKAEAARLLQPTLSALHSLHVLEDSRKAEDFLSLTLASRMAYILSPHDAMRRQKAVTAIALSEKISGLGGDREKEAERLIQEASGYDGFSFFTLENLQLLYRKDGKLYGRVESKARPSLVVTSDFSIIAQGRLTAAIYLFAEPRKAGIASEWAITKESIRKGLERGLSGDQIISMLDQASSENIPESVKSRIHFWEETLTSVKGSSVIALDVTERAERLIKAMYDKLEAHIISHPAPGLFLMRPDTAWQWSALLSSVGLDVLGSISVEKKEEQLPDTDIIELRPERTIPDERAVPFDRERRQSLLASDDIYRKALVLSGIIYDEAQETPALEDVVLGLDYQEKKRLISYSISHGRKVYAEFVGGSVIIAKAEKSAKDGYVLLNGREIEIAKIWKTALLPLSVSSITHLCPSDSDNL